jgi:hypothetical protein
MKESLKQWLLRSRGLERAWGTVRKKQYADEYRRRRDRYAAIAAERGLAYDEARVMEAIRARLAQRGYSVKPKKAGEIHTFAFIPSYGWHRHLLPDLRALGPLSAYDYRERGYDWNVFWSRTPAALETRRHMHAEALAAMRAVHKERPIDWVFVYASGVEVSPAMLRTITSELGVPVVSMCLDDKNSWESPPIDGARGGQVDVAREFDLSWTSARVATEWYLAEEGRPIYMPEGYDEAAYHPLQVQQDLGVSFLGAAYGFRTSVIEYLRREGVGVSTFGAGWPGSSWAKDPAEVFCRSAINLGMGGIGYSEELTNVKGRDFEIPGCGGGVYLTTFNADLAQHFEVGREILCYSGRDEMLELIRYYLAHPEEAAAIARRARERSVREHRWLHRYEKVCRILGIL